MTYRNRSILKQRLKNEYGSNGNSIRHDLNGNENSEEKDEGMDSDEAASEDEQEPAGVDAPEDCETVEAEGEEQVDVRVLEKPMMPSKAERDKHDSTHATYRTWCAHCVRGRGQSSHHSRWARKNNPSEVPEIVMDYCFPSQEDEDAAIILGIKC